MYPHGQDGGKTFSSGYFNKTTQTEVPVTFTVKLVGEVHPTDHHSLMVLNLIIRQGMEQLHLVELNRNFYDPEQASRVDQYPLEVWPGYLTSIRQHENEILLCAEITNKVLRTDSVYDQFQMMRRLNRDQIKKKLLGSVIMTKYNRKTYRIDDIDFDANPRSKSHDSETRSFYLYSFAMHSSLVFKVHLTRTDNKSRMFSTTKTSIS